MVEIYVAGPVVREVDWPGLLMEGVLGTRMPDWVWKAYGVIHRCAGSLGMTARLPVAEHRLEIAEALQFVRLTLGSIRRSAGVITVYVEGDASAVVESTMASSLGKSQMIIAREAGRLPRLVRGLPGVTSIVEPDEMLELEGWVRSFFAGLR